VARARPPRTELSRTVDLSVVVDGDHYEILVQKVMREARVSLWIATANVKEMRVEAPLGTVARSKGRYVSVLDTFDELLKRGVEIRFLHAGVPSRAFREELAKRTTLARRLAMRQCPRVHLKMIAVDGSELYLGSANFTGAGLGAKGEGRRNFELGILTHDDVLLDVAQARFDRIWSGKDCAGCRLRAVCPAPLDGKREPAASAPTKALRPRGEATKKATKIAAPTTAKSRPKKTTSARAPKAKRGEEG
jgi:phosphatidylserine/phosphatidylglycerophosphate/cardiolipin synthase-like enzyme